MTSSPAASAASALALTSASVSPCVGAALAVADDGQPRAGLDAASPPRRSRYGRPCRLVAILPADGEARRGADRPRDQGDGRAERDVDARPLSRRHRRSRASSASSAEAAVHLPIAGDQLAACHASCPFRLACRRVDAAPKAPRELLQSTRSARSCSPSFAACPSPAVGGAHHGPVPAGDSSPASALGDISSVGSGSFGLSSGDARQGRRRASSPTATSSSAMQRALDQARQQNPEATYATIARPVRPDPRIS